MLTLKKKCSGKSIILLVAIILLANVLNILIPGTAAAEPSKSLEIFGDGVKQPTLFTLEQLQEMEQVQKVYSAINTWPTKKWYVGEGVNLRSLLDSVGMSEEARMIRFYSNDGYSLTLTIKELFEDQRYCFPHFMDNSSSDGGGNILGSSEGESHYLTIFFAGTDDNSFNYHILVDYYRFINTAQTIRPLSPPTLGTPIKYGTFYSRGTAISGVVYFINVIPLAAQFQEASRSYLGTIDTGPGFIPFPRISL